jgi:tetrahydromethanopterin S-methyltransferase subunit C
VETFERYVHRTFLGSLALTLVPAGVLFLAGFGACARGVALGEAASLANLVLMAHDIRRQAGSLRRRRETASIGNQSLRMGIIAAALVYAALKEGISLPATIPALFSVQVVLVLGGLTGWLEEPD